MQYKKLKTVTITLDDRECNALSELLEIARVSIKDQPKDRWTSANPEVRHNVLCNLEDILS